MKSEMGIEEVDIIITVKLHTRHFLAIQSCVHTLTCLMSDEDLIDE